MKLLICSIFWLYGFTVTAETKTKYICFGESLQLKCLGGEQLSIKEAFYQNIEKDSTLCVRTNKTKVVCPLPQLVRLVGDLCNGKGECVVKNHSRVRSNEVLLCQSTMYLKVIYQCDEITGPPPRLFNQPPSLVDNSNDPSNINLSNDKNIKSTPVTTTKTTEPEAKEHKNGNTIAMQLLFTFLDIKLVVNHIKNRPKQVVLVVILSMAGGILIILAYCLLLYCCGKCEKTKDGVDIEDAQPTIEVSSPVIQTSVPVSYETVVVTRQNGTSTQTNIKKEPTLNTKAKDIKVMSTIRRSHSIDEGTQTDQDEGDTQANQTRSHCPSESLSHVEVQELGYLVDVMNYYNSKLDDDFYPDLQDTKTEITNTKKDDTNFYYTTDIKNPRHQPKKSNLKKQISFNSTSTTNRYMADEEFSSSDERIKTFPTSESSPSQSSQPVFDSYQSQSSQPVFDSYPSQSSQPVFDSYPSQSSQSVFGSFPTQSSQRTNVCLEENEIDFFSPEAIFNGDTLRFKSVPRTPKLGIRGDGFDVIMGEPQNPQK